MLLRAFRRTALLSAFACIAFGQSEVPFGASPEALLERAAAAPSEDDDHSAVVWLDRTIRIDDDGTSHETFHLIYKALTDDGAEAWDEVSASWSPWRQERPVIRARVVSPGGEQTDLDPATIAESAASTNRDSIYRDTRVLRAPLPAIRAGAVVEYTVETRGTAPLFEAGFVSKYLVNQSVPTAYWRLKIDAPEAHPLRYSAELADGMEPTVETADGRTVVTFEAGPVEKYEAPESSLPKDEPRYPAVSFATGRSWSELSRAYDRIITEKASGAGVEGAARDAIEGLSSREEKIQALASALHERVRYTGLEFGQAGFIPYEPEDVLARQYGDCKDKSTVLIAMLRAVGVPAYLAMLRTGPGQDVDPTLPGMGRFDHAVVYAPGEQDYWIDATAEFSRIDSPPTSVQGRYALIAAPDTDGLVLIPKAASVANKSVERRVLKLADLGPGEATEETTYFGAFEHSMRSNFDGYDQEATHESLEQYVQENYLAGSLKSFEVSDSKDFSDLFRLRLDAEECGRAATDLKQAVVAIRLENLANSVPDELAAPPEDDDERVGDYVVDVPFVLEWRYEIVPPVGFRLRELPKPDRREIGPMVFTAEYEETGEGVVEARLVFDSGRDRLTPEEVRAVQEGIDEFRSSEPVMIWFDHEAEALMEAGEVREALDSMKEDAAASPDRPLPWVRLARAYLAAGLGESARRAAERGIEADEEAAVAHATLGWVLQHDSIGRRFVNGFDYHGAVEAHRRAHELKPEDDEMQLDLAILLEHNVDGKRYAPGSDLRAAIGHYREVLERKDYPAFRNNLLTALMKAGDFEGLRQEAAKVDPKNETSLTFAVIAETALEGVGEAMRFAKESLTNAEQRVRVVSSAAQTLINERRYALVGDLMESVARDLQNPSQALAQATLFRKTKRAEDVELDDSEPSTVVLRMFLALFGDGDWREELPPLFSRHARDQFEVEEEARRIDRELRMQRAGLSNPGAPAPVVVDLMAGARQSRTEGDDEGGYLVRDAYLVGNQRIEVEAFVVLEDGRYVLLDVALDGQGDFTGIPPEVYARIEAGDLAGAQRLLDWAREQVTPGGGDDPFAGPFFPHVWQRGAQGDPERMRFAAATLHAGSIKLEAKTAVPILQEAVRKASKQDRAWFQKALALALLQSEQWEDLLPWARENAKRYPESDIAFAQYGVALLKVGLHEELQQVAERRLQADPDDEVAAGLLHDRFMKRGDWDGLREFLGERIESGSATPTDRNNYAWGAVMAETVDEHVAEVIGDAALGGEDTTVMHTQACVYAALGRTALARQVLLQMMDAEGLVEPDSKSWYLLGRIAEDYGEIETAANAYARVERPDEKIDEASSVWRLAQNRLEGLGDRR